MILTHSSGSVANNPLLMEKVHELAPYSTSLILWLGMFEHEQQIENITTPQNETRKVYTPLYLERHKEATSHSLHNKRASNPQSFPMIG